MATVRLGTMTDVEVLTAVLQVSADRDALRVLLQHDAGTDPAEPRWRLPGGAAGDRETLAAAARRRLGTECGITRVAHLEQLAVFSDPDRIPGTRTVASTYLGLVPRDVPADPAPGSAAQWYDVDALPRLSHDHAAIIGLARSRLAAKLSYTNIAFALAPQRFPMSELSEIYGAALGYPVDSTNLLRILSRRSVVVATGTVGKTGRSGGRPPSLYAFADGELRVTDEFATLRPPL